MSNPLRIGIIGLVHDHIWDNLPFLQGPVSYTNLRAHETLR